MYDNRQCMIDIMYAARIELRHIYKIRNGKLKRAAAKLFGKEKETADIVLENAIKELSQKINKYEIEELDVSNTKIAGELYSLRINLMIVAGLIPSATPTMNSVFDDAYELTRQVREDDRNEQKAKTDLSNR